MQIFYLKTAFDSTVQEDSKYPWKFHWKISGNLRLGERLDNMCVEAFTFSKIGRAWRSMCSLIIRAKFSTDILKAATFTEPKLGPVKSLVEYYHNPKIWNFILIA